VAARLGGVQEGEDAVDDDDRADGEQGCPEDERAPAAELQELG
jgi:hypothetical protein